MRHVKWVKPALLWDGQAFSAIQDKPAELLEMDDDKFVPQFLEAMSAPPVRQNGTYAQATAAAFLNAKRLAGAGLAKLFQPLHNRFYLVIASLVCHTAGLPDKTVDRKNDETVSFVVRRVRTGGKEEGWSDKEGWKPVAAEVVLSDEERHPMQPINVLTGARRADPLFPPQRTLYFGYVITGNREKYQSPSSATMAFLDDATKTPAQKLNEYFAEVKKIETNFDHRLDEFDTRVLASWRFLVTDGRERANGSMGIIVDLGDFLARALPDVWKAIEDNNSAGLATKPKQRLLYDAIARIEFPNQPGKLLKDALREQRSAINGGVARGAGDFPNAAGANYDLRTALRPQYDASGVLTGMTQLTAAYLTGPDATDDTLIARVRAALAEEPAPTPATPPDPQVETVLKLIKGLVKPTIVDAGGQPVVDRYVIRLVYAYDPECPPVVSRESREFELAKHFDPDAPARLTRLEMPSIRPKDLRKYAHGVGIQMTNDLRQVIERVHPGMLKGDGLNPPVSLSLDVICTFSIPIITLVALIVMFIFLILFNIIFWWLAFLRICFPIPRFNAS